MVTVVNTLLPAEPLGNKIPKRQNQKRISGHDHLEVAQVTQLHSERNATHDVLRIWLVKVLWRCCGSVAVCRLYCVRRYVCALASV